MVALYPSDTAFLLVEVSLRMTTVAGTLFFFIILCFCSPLAALCRDVIFSHIDWFQIVSTLNVRAVYLKIIHCLGLWISSFTRLVSG